MDGAQNSGRRGGGIGIQRPWSELQAELALALPNLTYEQVIQPLHGEWKEQQLLVSGPAMPLAWAEGRLAHLFQAIVQSDVLFVPS